MRSLRIYHSELIPEDAKPKVSGKIKTSIRPFRLHLLWLMCLFTFLLFLAFNSTAGTDNT